MGSKELEDKEIQLLYKKLKEIIFRTDAKFEDTFEDSEESERM